MSKTPLLFTTGNHEIEELPTGARFTSVNARYPGPPATGIYSSAIHDFTNQLYLQTIVQGQPTDDEFDPMGAYKNMFYSVDVPGAKIIFLTTFIGGDDFSSSSIQYKWFLSELKKVNRTLTPWLIVNFHFPMYTSYVGYERTNPVYNYSLNSCGTVHMTVGDGGNIEGVTEYFVDELIASLSYCAPGKATTQKFPEWQPQACFSYPAPGGAYCYSSQPDWSAYRSPSWGFGVLTILNQTTAHWLWNNTDNGSTVFDEAYFTRNPACMNGAGDRR
ncbi:hypothetical protein CEUSTIGMA_g6454.t1 [Chlamydomonas eustigma]|uniref:Purple acid phosphatase C-terminal domain-containing protein n=1 Tax=Chlamydomonas eustigma TaxID=1157962 RepID=A0A250X7F1_9CHLO|nr:hypothetical protein CEUSTIGMA_g6454.t1 [Chlamydomonas eustigma]|eukprot:GAX79014.1 hypothetical protein CEUSTIGMA_g6454.t1 [Chlamydomonas eustigma]